jgi:hypothetical protein
MPAGDFGTGFEDIHPVAIAAFYLALDQGEINPRVSKRTATAITGNCHLFDFDGFRGLRGCSGHISILIGSITGRTQFIDREGCAMIPNVPRCAKKLAQRITA